MKANASVQKFKCIVQCLISLSSHDFLRRVSCLVRLWDETKMGHEPFRGITAIKSTRRISTNLGNFTIPNLKFGVN